MHLTDKDSDHFIRQRVEDGPVKVFACANIYRVSNSPSGIVPVHNAEYPDICGKPLRLNAK